MEPLDRSLRARTRPRPPRPETQHSRRMRFRLAGRAGAWLLRLWGGTWKVEWDVHSQTEERLRRGDGVIYAFWHEHLLSLAYTHRFQNAVVMVSESEDGEYISQVLHQLGYGTARGSSSRSGLRALLTLARIGARGFDVAITPDGPRGPRRQLQPGLLLLAQRSGLPIVLLAVGARRRRRLGSWDRMILAHPFSQLRIWESEPIFLDPDLSMKELEGGHRAALESRLAEMEEVAARWAGDGEPPSGAPASMEIS